MTKQIEDESEQNATTHEGWKILCLILIVALPISVFVTRNYFAPVRVIVTNNEKFPFPMSYGEYQDFVKTKRSEITREAEIREILDGFATSFATGQPLEIVTSIGTADRLRAISWSTSTSPIVSRLAHEKNIFVLTLTQGDHQVKLIFRDVPREELNPHGLFLQEVKDIQSGVVPRSS